MRVINVDGLYINADEILFIKMEDKRTGIWFKNRSLPIFVSESDMSIIDKIRNAEEV